jgi:hypothetical protein
MSGSRHSAFSRHPVGKLVLTLKSKFKKPIDRPQPVQVFYRIDEVQGDTMSRVSEKTNPSKSISEVELHPRGEAPTKEKAPNTFKILPDDKSPFHQKFTEIMEEFIANHIIVHEAPKQRHFKNICDIFASTEKTPENKLIEITAELQKAIEYRFSRTKQKFGFDRKTQTSLSYCALRTAIYENLSFAFQDNQPLIEKVKIALGREPDDHSFSLPAGIRRLTSPLSSSETFDSDGHMEAKSMAVDSSEIATAFARSTPPAAEEETTSPPPAPALMLAPEVLRRETLRSSLSAEELDRARKAFCHFLTDFFLQGGNIDANNLKKIRKYLAEPRNQKISAQSLMTTQVLLMDTAYVVGEGRSEQTQALYTNLQEALFERGFNREEVTSRHRSYRRAIEEECQRRAEIYAMAMAHSYI